jgi:chromosomal replication initiator protein
LHTDWTPDSFVLHNGVQDAYAAVIQVTGDADGKGKPCFLYGDRGLGKSHLMHAAGYLIKAARPTTKILALSASSFATDVAKATQSGGTDSLMRRFRRLDVLLLDDIELLADDLRAQEALVAVLGDLLARERRVAITCGRHPEELQWLVPAPLPLTASGVSTRIDPPDLKGRVAILRRIGAECGVEMLPDAVAYFIARLPPGGGGVRELAHGLRRVLANAEFTGQPVSLSLAKAVLRPAFACPRCGHGPASWSRP